VENSQAGKNNAWSYGMRWRPVDDLLIRATESQSFRAPAITELFLPQATSFMTATDPCDSRNINSGPSPATRLKNCQAAFQALGLPANYSLTSQVQAATVQGSTAGNPNLKNEIARQETLGFVYQPHYIKGLSLKFDWMKIDITNAIASFNLTSIMQVCYDSPNPPADACSRFQRGTSASAKPGQILGMGEAVGNGTTAAGPLAGYVNAGYTNFQGYTWGAYYNLALEDVPGVRNLGGGRPGVLDLSLDFYHISKLETSVTGLGFDLNNDKTEIGQASNQWKAEIAYRRNPVTFNWTTTFIGKSLFNRDYTIETRWPLEVAAYYYHSAGMTYDLTELVGHPMNVNKVQARFVVKNVFNQQPPYGTTGAGVYDLMGRYFEFGLKAKF